MSQRNPQNARYQDDAHGGKTRKSSASAKPAASNMGMVHYAAPKSKRQKLAEQRARERRIEEKRLVGGTAKFGTLDDVPKYRFYRNLWWVLIGAGVALVLLGVYFAYNPEYEAYSLFPLIPGYVLIAAAIYVDVWKTRKIKQEYKYAVASNRSKAFRAAQKQAAAEARAAAKAAAENPEELPRARSSVIDRIGGWFRSLIGNRA